MKDLSDNFELSLQNCKKGGRKYSMHHTILFKRVMSTMHNFETNKYRMQWLSLVPFLDLACDLRTSSVTLHVSSVFYAARVRSTIT